MKKFTYIALFTLLGILVSFLLHAVLEIAVVRMLLADFETYNLGLSWSGWFVVHHIGSVVLLLMGVGVGVWQGRYWWRRLYVDSSNRDLTW